MPQPADKTRLSSLSTARQRLADLLAAMHRAVALLLIGAAYRGADALTIWRQQTERFSDSADYIAVEFLTDALAVVCYRDLEVIEPTANTPTHP